MASQSIVESSSDFDVNKSFTQAIADTMHETFDRAILSPLESLVAIFDASPPVTEAAKGHLYHVPRTISSPIVQCLHELDRLYKNQRNGEKIVGECVFIHQMTFASIKEPEYLAINPMGTSPGYKEGSMIMWESGAVLDYLLETYDTLHLLHPPPKRTMERAKYLHLKQFIIATVYPFLASLYLHVMTNDKEDQDEDYVKTAKNKFLMLMGPVINKGLGKGPYFFGQTPTALDYLATKPLNNAFALGLLEGFPRLASHLHLMRSRPSYKKAYEAVPSAVEYDEEEEEEDEDRKEAASAKVRSFVLIPGEKEVEEDE